MKLYLLLWRFETNPETVWHEQSCCLTAAKQQNLTCDNYCGRQRCSFAIKPGQLRLIQNQRCVHICMQIFAHAYLWACMSDLNVRIPSSIPQGPLEAIKGDIISAVQPPIITQTAVTTPLIVLCVFHKDWRAIVVLLRGLWPVYRVKTADIDVFNGEMSLLSIYHTCTYLYIECGICRKKPRGGSDMRYKFIQLSVF